MTIKAAAPKLPPGNQTRDTSLVNIQPPFGTNPPSGPLTSADTDLNERSIHSDPRELWYLALPNKLTPQQTLQILRSALAGDVWQQWQLCSLMLDTWPTFRKAAHELMEGASYMRYAVHPFAEEGGKPTKSAQRKADTVNRAIRGMRPNPFNDERGFSGTVYALCDALLNGLSIVELIWELRTSTNGGREWLPKSGAWVHPRHFTFTNDGHIAVFDENYNRLLWPVNGAPTYSIPDERKFLCGQFISRGGSALGAGFMRPLAWAWAARQFNCEWMLNTAKQYGAPFIDITYKPGAISTDPNDPNSDIARINAMLKGAGSQRRLIHPEGTTAEIHPATSLGKENPQRVLEEKADDWCLYLLLGQKGTTASTPGQLGQDESHENVKNERILGLANWLARNPLRQFARAVLLTNYGDDAECPNIEPDTTKPLKPEQVGMLASSMSGSRVPVRADEFYKKLGFTQPEPGEIVFNGGRVMVMGEALTEEEQFRQDLQKQVAQGEAQMALQAEAMGGGQPDDESAKAMQWPKGTRQTISAMSDQELDRLEKLVTAAERASHPNGELTALKAALEPRPRFEVKL